MAREKLAELKSRLAEISHLRGVASLARWDQRTFMPPGDTPARGRQLSTLNRLMHEKFTDERIGFLLDWMEPLAQDMPEDDTAALLSLTRRRWEKAVRVPGLHAGQYPECAIP